MFHVYKRYGSRTALYDVSLRVSRGEFLFVTGPSGAGKTTLLRLLFLDETISEGQILVDGINLQRIPRNRIPLLRRKISVVFQDFRLIRDYTVYENIALVLEAKGASPRHVPARIRQALRMVGLEDCAHAYPPRLSGGEQQRVAVARAAAANPLILLADEPTGNLDTETADMVMALLIRLHRRGTTIVVATHDDRLLSKAPARVVSLAEGRLYGAQA
ncbi:MAG: cell division ATP-binding protein FtsE [Deltaproteobacteria bacterium]|nr:cell division ATP-binding protein FtsE [Deltaproteobacteria bacterium]